MEPREFLAAHPPFDRLAREALDRVERTLEVVYASRGEPLLRRSDSANPYLYVVRKGTVRLEIDGRRIQIVEEGEPFGYPSLLAGSSPHAESIAEEDCLLYRIPRETFQHLMGHEGFADYFLAGLAQRLRRTAALEPSPLAGDLSAPVVSLVTRPPVTIERGASVVAAARRMTENRVSSLLVVGEPSGIVTDRDLRVRVLAEDRGRKATVEDVMSSPLLTAPAQASVFESLLFMLEHRIHHLPLARGDQVVGVVTDTDLLRHHIKSPIYLLNRIEKLEGAEAFTGYAEELAGMVDVLFRGDLDAFQIGRIVSSINDAAVGRLLRLTEAELGPPPCPYAWIVFGSEGRKEQALLTDQDNALIYREATPAAEEYFAALAERVVKGLVRLGIPPCPGGFMATNWRRPLAEWEKLFSGWMRRPEPQALIEAANFFDFRRVGGELSLEPLDELFREASKHGLFLAHMAKNALDFRPPLGLFHRIREQAEGVDLKKGGIIPIVSLGRLHALEAGILVRGTLDRLDAAAAAGRISRDGAENLGEAFRFLLRLRLEDQLEAKRAGQPVDNQVRLANLSPLERRHLKDTFLAVREMQEALAMRYKTDLIG
jgi:CBS domain-containing protein